MSSGKWRPFCLDLSLSMYVSCDIYQDKSELCNFYRLSVAICGHRRGRNWWAKPELLSSVIWDNTYLYIFSDAICTSCSILYKNMHKTLSTLLGFAMRLYCGHIQHFSMFKVRQFNPCKQFVIFKYHLIKTFWLILICFPIIIVAILLPIFMKCMAETWCDKPCCDITVVAICVTKKKQPGYLTPWDNGKMCTYNQALNKAVRGPLGTYTLSVFVHLLTLFS